jgi:hypothetical protein
MEVNQSRRPCRPQNPISNAALFGIAYREWCAKDSVAKNMTDFQNHFRLANQDPRMIITPGTVGFHGAHQAVMNLPSPGTATGAALLPGAHQAIMTLPAPYTTTSTAVFLALTKLSRLRLTIQTQFHAPNIGPTVASTIIPSMKFQKQAGRSTICSDLDQDDCISRE